MRRNLGILDRAARIVVAVVVVVLLLFLDLPRAATVALGVVAAALLVTSAVGTCPAYLPVGLDTRAPEEKKATHPPPTPRKPGRHTHHGRRH